MIDHVLTQAQAHWDQAKRGIHGSRPVVSYSFRMLMEGHSLIQVYICCALALSFFNVDVMWYIEREEEHNRIVNGGGSTGPYRRRYRMPDKDMHSVYMPLTCAMKLCDTIRPERLVASIAPYLAEMVPSCSTGETAQLSFICAAADAHPSSAPVMLLYAQNLETYIVQEHPIAMVSGSPRHFCSSP